MSGCLRLNLRVDKLHLAMGADKDGPLWVRCNVCLRLLLVPTVKRPILAVQTLPINNHGVVSMWMSATDSQVGRHSTLDNGCCQR